MAISFGVNMTSNVPAVAGSAAHQVSVLTAQMKSLQTAMIKANASDNAKSFNKSAEAFSKVSAQVDTLKSSIPKATEATTSMNGSMSMLTAELGAVAAGAAVAMAAVAALGAAVAVGMHLAISAADKNRQLKTTFEALGAGGQVTLDMLGRLEDALPFSKTQLGAWGRSLAEQGVKGAALEKGIRAAASAVALMGDESAGAKVSSLVSALARGEMTGKSVKDIGKALRGVGVNAAEVGASLGVNAKQLQAMVKSGQGLDKIGNAIEDALIKKGKGAIVEYGKSWASMTATAKKYVENIFEGVGDTAGYKEFIASLQQLVFLFSQTSSTGKDATSGVTKGFGALFGLMAKGITIMTIFGLDTATSLGRIYIAIYPVLVGFAKLWEAADGSAALTGALFLVKLALWTVAIGTLIVLSPIILLAAAFYGVAFAVAWAVGWIIKKWDAMSKWFGDTANDMVTWGSDVIDGLWTGIKDGWANLIKNFKALVDLLPAAVKKALGIASPSKVFMAIGAHVTEGMHEGIQSGSPKIAASSAKMAGAAVDGASGRGSSQASAGKSLTVRVERGAIVINGAGGNVLDLTEEALANLLNRIAESQGLPA